MNLRIKVDARSAIKATKRIRRRTPVVTAQELNRQRTQSRTRITRGLSKLLGIRPQRRVRNRVLLPKGGRATRQKLRAIGLALFEAMPARWMAARDGTLNLAGGARLRTTPGRASRPFPGTNTSGNRDVFQRRTAARLPISNAMVDVSTPGYGVRLRVLADLAREFPRRWEKRMATEIRKAFR